METLIQLTERLKVFTQGRQWERVALHGPPLGLRHWIDAQSGEREGVRLELAVDRIGAGARAVGEVAQALPPGFDGEVAVEAVAAIDAEAGIALIDAARSGDALVG